MAAAGRGLRDGVPAERGSALGLVWGAAIINEKMKYNINDYSSLLIIMIDHFSVK
jgi:hypothetical protein